MSNKKKWIIGILIAVIVLPIIFNRAMVYISAKISGANMNRPVGVEVGKVVEGDVYQKTESVGRIEAKYTVDVVARINGWLQKRYFKEGDYVKKGQTLFLIQPNEYAIAVQQAQAAVRQSQAALINSEKELKRAKELVKNDFVSKSYYDQALATRDGNKAQLDVNKANLANAQLNLSYTQIKSPVDGKIGKIMITEGNLVSSQSGALTRIVSTTPIYAYFTIKSEDYIKFKRTDENDLSNMNVRIQLADGSKYDEEGKLEFVNNEVDQTAGTISLRATFKNNDNLLVPGDFVNVVATSINPRKVILVPQVAVSNSTQGHYVWIIDENKQAQQQFIKISSQEGDKWVVEEGLKPGDTVITAGFQKLKPGSAVEVIENIQKEEKKDKE